MKQALIDISDEDMQVLASDTTLDKAKCYIIYVINVQHFKQIHISGFY